MKTTKKIEHKDKTRDREGHQAKRKEARKAQEQRRAFESGHGAKNWR